MSAPNGNVLDLVLITLLAVQTLLGWRRGVLATVLGTAGLVLGGVTGIWAVGLVPLEPLLWSPLPMAVVVVPAVILVLLALIGQRIGIDVGRAVVRGVGRRRRATAAETQTRPPAGRAAVLGRPVGALIALLTTVVLIWAIVPTLRGVGYGPLTQQVKESTVLARIDDALVGPVRTSVLPVRAWLGRSTLHRVLTVEGIAPPTAPDRSVRGATAVARAAASVVKVRTVSEQCGRGHEGTGWVVSGDRVVTNAHVVAGASRVAVQTLDGDGWLATVIAFDSARDVAVLRVPEIAAAPLASGPRLSRGDDAAVAGYPLDGPYVVRAATVRSLGDVASTTIYGRGRVVREVYTLYATVRQGNSGGPLLDTRGRAVGMVYARSADDSRVGYALAMSEVNAVLAPTAGQSAPVGTGACTND